VPEKVAAQVVAELGKTRHSREQCRQPTSPSVRWPELTPERIKYMLDVNLNYAFYCAAAALNVMRPRKQGLLIHTASMAGRVIGLLSGAGYVAAKHGVVAMSHAINMEEFVNGILSTVVCPGEVADADSRPPPVPVSKEDRARMLHRRMSPTSSCTWRSCRRASA